MAPRVGHRARRKRGTSTEREAPRSFLKKHDKKAMACERVAQAIAFVSGARIRSVFRLAAPARLAVAP